MRFLKILFLALLAFSLSSCSYCLAMTTTSPEVTVTVPVTRLHELQTIILRQEQQLQTLQTLLTEPQKIALEQAKQLQEAQSSIATLTSDLDSARISLANSSRIIREQNRSLETLSEDIKAERNKWKIRTVKYCLIGFGIGYLVKQG